MRILRAKQALALEGMPRTPDGRPALTEQEAAFDAEMALAMGQDLSYGNGADVDNLEAAGTPIVMERDLLPGSSESLLAAREAEAARSFEERGPFYDQQRQAYEAEFGPIGARNADVTSEQLQGRERRREREDVRRHSPYAEEQRIARMAERAGVSMAEARAMVQQGYDQAAADRGIPASAAWQVDGQNRSVPPDFDQFRDAYTGLRDAVRDKRAEDKAARVAEVAKRAMLAQNPMGYLGRDDINNEQRELVTQRMQGRRRPGDDPRIRVAEINAASAEAQAAAEREGRVSQQQWLEQTRIAAEERAAARAEANAAAQRTFDAEQKRLDRDAQAASGNRASSDVVAKLQADLDARRLEHDAQMAAMERQGAEAQRRHEASLSESRLQAEERMKQFDAKYGLDKKEMEDKQKALADAQAKDARELLLQPLEAKYGIGVRQIADNIYDTPEAEESLAAMAYDADKSWTGFYNSDAVRLDAILSRLITDPTVRQGLVDTYGLGAMSASGPGGRSGPISGVVNFFSGNPAYPSR
jgi:hypothetical protein